MKRRYESSYDEDGNLVVFDKATDKLICCEVTVDGLVKELNRLNNVIESLKDKNRVLKETLDELQVL